MSSMFPANPIMQPSLPSTGVGEDSQLFANSAQVHRDGEVRHESGRAENLHKKPLPKETDSMAQWSGLPHSQDGRPAEKMQLPFHGFSYVA